MLGVTLSMMTIPVLALVADTLLVRPVDVPAPWYSVATGVLSIVVTLLLCGIAAALLGMARAVKGVESRLGGKMQGLAEELIPLARNLNQIATQLSEVTVEARADLKKLRGTIEVVDDAVRDAIDAGEARLSQFGTLLDAVQDEAQATIASATGIVRGVRTGTGSLVRSLFSRKGKTNGRRATRHVARHADDTDALDEADVRRRLAVLEAALADMDDDVEEEDADEIVVAPRRAAAGPVALDADEGDIDWDDEDDDDDDDDEDELDDSVEDELEDDDDDDDDDEDDELDDDEDDDDELDEDDDEDDDDRIDEEEDADDEAAEPSAPRHGGPRIRQRRHS